MKSFVLNTAGGFALLFLLVIGMQGSALYAGAAIGISVAVTLLIYLGPERLGIALVILATYLSPMNGLKIGGTGNVTFADLCYVAAFGLLLPRLLESASKMPRLYTWGVTLLSINALVVTVFSPTPIPSLTGFMRVFWAIIVIPIVLHRLKASRTLLYTLAWAYVLGQITSLFYGLIKHNIEPAGGRSLGWTNHPNFYGLGGQLAFALCVFLFYRTPRDKRWIVVLAALLTAFSVYNSGSRASLLCIVVTVLLWPVVERTAISSYILVSFAALVAISLNYLLANAPEGSSLSRLQGGGSAGGSDQAREQLFGKALQLFLDSPIVGHGWITDIIQYHNAYLEVGIAGGIFAMVAFVMILIALIKPLFDEPVPNRLAFVAVSYAVFAAIGPTIYDRVLWGALGLVLALHHSADDEVGEDETRVRRSIDKKTPTPPVLTPRRTR